MLESLTKKFRPEKGQVVVFTVLLLPLILGVVVLVIEIGNVYVQYQELQNVADTAVVTEDENLARKVVKANFEHQLRKEKFPNAESPDGFAVMIYTASTGDGKFYLKLKKNIPTMFIKAFGDPIPVDAYAASKDNELTHFTADPTDDTKFDWGEPVTDEP